MIVEPGSRNGNMLLPSATRSVCAERGAVVRVFEVRKDDGSSWWMTYTSNGVRWDPMSTSPQAGTADAPGLAPDGPPPGGAASAIGLAAQTGLRALMPGVNAITQLVQTAAMVGMWWEDHQRRLFDEARQEEYRRITWLGDITARWAAVHKAGDHLNLRVTEHLAREARETMNVLLSNKRVALPQSVLCDIGEIQDTMGSFRALILTQFEELAANPALDLKGVLREAMPDRRLDMDFIRLLGQDPAAALEASLRNKAKGGFDREFSEPLLHADSFTNRVFPSILPAVPTVKSFQEAGLVDQVVSFIASALPNLTTDEVNPEALERRTTFRELTLLPAEVLRVRALNSAWLATSAIVTRITGTEVAVQVGSRGVNLALEPSLAGRELLGRMSDTEQRTQAAQ